MVCIALVFWLVVSIVCLYIGIVFVRGVLGGDGVVTGVVSFLDVFFVDGD